MGLAQASAGTGNGTGNGLGYDGLPSVNANGASGSGAGTGTFSPFDASANPTDNLLQVDMTNGQWMINPDLSLNGMDFE